METLTFKLQEDNFEGPLDLLLYLVGKNKMNLYDINIMELIEQYTAAIQTMQADKLEVSSEFIDMAAHLVQMKSALLLPYRRISKKISKTDFRRAKTANSVSKDACV